MKRLITSFVVAVFLIPSFARAHDFWIEPSTYRPEVGTTFTASLRVGQDFIGDPLPRTSSLIEKFIVVDGLGEYPVGGFEHQDPAGYIGIRKAGPALIGYRSKPVSLELPAAKFEEYLKSEGQEQIIAIRARRGESAKPDKEIFSRCAKSIITAGVGTGAVVTAPLGFRLEIVPQQNPTIATARSTFRLLYEGKPLVGAQISALRQDSTDKPMTQRTDASGRVSFDLRTPGVWLIKSVHIIPAAAGTGADWESLWASLTFER